MDSADSADKAAKKAANLYVSRGRFWWADEALTEQIARYAKRPYPGEYVHVREWHQVPTWPKGQGYLGVSAVLSRNEITPLFSSGKDR